MQTKSMQQAAAIEAAPRPILDPRSAEALVGRELAALGEWLAAQGLDLRSDTAPMKAATGSTGATATSSAEARAGDAHAPPDGALMQLTAGSSRSYSFFTTE